MELVLSTGGGANRLHQREPYRGSSPAARPAAGQPAAGTPESGSQTAAVSRISLSVSRLAMSPLVAQRIALSKPELTLS